MRETHIDLRLVPEIRHMVGTSKPDPADLAYALLIWGEVRTWMDGLEEVIQDAVIDLGETQVIGYVRARYSKGRDTYGYQQAVEETLQEYLDDPNSDPRNAEAVQSTIAGHTTETTTSTTDWKAVCAALKLDAPVIKDGTASVKLLLE